MIISISDIWTLALAQHAQFLNDVLDEGLGSLHSTTVERLVSRFLLKNKEAIVSGLPEDLLKCIEDYHSTFGGSIYRGCANEIMRRVFDYDTFSQKSNKPWNAYHLCVQALYKVCCYCHLVTTGTCLPDEATKGYRPPIDHYYGKADYPFLALSLYNFVPCCEKCNGSQMKGATDFSKLPHLNPLIDDESIEFSLEPVDAVASSLAEFLTLSLPREKYRLTLITMKNHHSAAASIRTFQLANRYKEYSYQAFYLARKIRGLSTRLDFHKNDLDFRTEIEDYLEFKPEEYKSVPYGKARLCIAKQFGANILEGLDGRAT